MKHYPIYLLDADETLFDFHRAEYTAFSGAYQKLTGKSCTDGEFSLYSAINDGLWKAMERGEITKEEIQRQRFARFLNRLGMKGNGDVWNETYLDGLSQSHFLLDGALELCRELSKNAALYLATNGIERVQKKRLAGSAIRPYITDIFVSEELGVSKPDPLYFDRLLERIGNPPRSEVLMVGDSLTSDIAGGIAAGLDTCWFHPQGKPRPENVCPTFEILSLKELFIF